MAKGSAVEPLGSVLNTNSTHDSSSQATTVVIRGLDTTLLDELCT